MTALLENGFTTNSLGTEHVDYILDAIQRRLQDGVTGASESNYVRMHGRSLPITPFTLQLMRSFPMLMTHPVPSQL